MAACRGKHAAFVENVDLHEVVHGKLALGFFGCVPRQAESVTESDGCNDLGEADGEKVANTRIEETVESYTFETVWQHGDEMPHSFLQGRFPQLILFQDGQRQPHDTPGHESALQPSTGESKLDIKTGDASAITFATRVPNSRRKCRDPWKS